MSEPIRIDDAERIFPRIEAADLGDHGSSEIDIEPRQDRLQLLPIDVAVLRARRIDRGRIHVDPRELDRRRGVLAGAEDGGVVGFQVRREEPQHGRVRGGQVDVAAPDPLPSPLAQVRERSRLGIVDDDVVVLVLETRGVEFVEMAIRGLHVRRQAHVGALERVVHRLRRREERVRTVEDEPVHSEADLPLQGGAPAVTELDLEVQDKEFVVLLGPSGCGKTTTLRCVAGLESADEGEIYIGDRLVNDLDPKDRNVAMVFQSYALYPHMTVYQNMAFPLENAKVAEREIIASVNRVAKLLQI